MDLEPWTRRHTIRVGWQRQICTRLNSPRLNDWTMETSQITELYRFKVRDFFISAGLSCQSSACTGNKVVVRPEEALIVIFVLILWMGAIGLFVHRWGKIRNCEPYAPKFEAEHQRGSCHDLLNKRMSTSCKLVTQGPTLQATADHKSFTQGLVSLVECYNQFKPKMLYDFQLTQFTRALDRIRCSCRLSTLRPRNRPEKLDRPWIYIRCWARKTARLFRTEPKT